MLLVKKSPSYEYDKKEQTKPIHYLAVSFSILSARKMLLSIDGSAPIRYIARSKKNANFSLFVVCEFDV